VIRRCLLAAAVVGTALLVGVSARVAGAERDDAGPAGHVFSVPDQPWTLITGDAEPSPVLRAAGAKTSHLLVWALAAAAIAAGAGGRRRALRPRTVRSASASTRPAAARAPPR
jgi:hypothetical protein